MSYDIYKAGEGLFSARCVVTSSTGKFATREEAEKEIARQEEKDGIQVAYNLLMVIMLCIAMIIAVNLNLEYFQ